MLSAAIAKNLGINNYATAYFNLEMTNRQMIDRWISDESDIEQWKIHYNPLKINYFESKKMQDVIDKLNKLPIFIDDTPGNDFYKIVSKIRIMYRKHKIKIVFLDHIGLIEIRDKFQNENLKLGFMTRRFKALAKELNIVIIGLCQLNRGVDNRADKKPFLSDLRESGEIEQNSDKVLLLYRDEYYNKDTEKKGILEIAIAKNREGRTGHCELLFIPEYCRIIDIPKIKF